MRVLVIAPHMDDEVLGCGGVIQRFDDVTVLFVSEREDDQRYTEVDGYLPYSGLDRAEEMEQVALKIGYLPVRLCYPLHGLDRMPTLELVEAFEPHLDGVELIFAPGPSNDADHVAVRKAVQALRRPHRYSGSILEYHVWGTLDPFAAAVLVPLNGSEVANKLTAIAAYQTQVAPGGQADPLYPYSPISVEAYMLATGRLCHARHAEAFMPIRLVPNHATARLFE